MDKLKLLQSRKKQIVEVGKSVRDDISALIDKDSFVELSAFSFSKNDFYGEVAEGEGVVTGFATVDGYPFYIIAQNAAVLSGGVSKANCEKIIKCLNQAEKNSTPIIYLLSTLGVQIGEGVNVLEGLAELILKSTRLKGELPQYLVVNGEVYGQVALLAAACDFTFFINKKSVLAANSPLVISAKDGVNLNKFQVGGSDALKGANIVSFNVDSLSEVREKIVKITDLISTPVVDCDDLNKSLSSLNSAPTAENILKIFDKDSLIEIGASYCPEIKCILGRIGGIAVASVIFAEEGGCKLNAANVRKISDFAVFACDNSLPFINFVNTLGIEEDLKTNNSVVLREINDLVSVFDYMDSAKLSVVYGKAIGLGYTLFAAKSMGYDYVYAFANAKIALFDSAAGAEIEFADEKADKEKLAERYSDENSDPVNAAKGGYIDNIIEPAFIRQYLIASLQMLLR